MRQPDLQDRRAQLGDRLELTEPPALYGQPVGRVKEVLGEIDDPGMEIEIAVRKYGVPHEFSDACIALARSLPDKVQPKDKKHRVDLTDVPLVTIDGEDARDFDDAVYAEEVAQGWRLVVAIADVSHYVREGSALDQDAFDRSTSVYFPERAVHMFPSELATGLCSLNPHVDRLVQSCLMEIDPSGKVVRHYSSADPIPALDPAKLSTNASRPTITRLRPEPLAA